MLSKEVKLHFIKKAESSNYNESIQFIIECARKNFAKMPEFQNTEIKFFCFLDVQELTFLNRYLIKCNSNDKGLIFSRVILIPSIIYVKKNQFNRFQCNLQSHPYSIPYPYYPIPSTFPS